MPDSGEVFIFGRSLSTMTERELFEMRAHVGMVFQESALFDSLSVEDNVAYRLHEEHVPEAEAHTRVEEALRFVELEKAIAKFPSELSGGMRTTRLDCARHHLQARPHPLRLAHRRARPHHVHHHHRTRRQTARRLPDHLAAHHAPPAGRLHYGDPLLQPRSDKKMELDPQQRPRRQRKVPRPQRRPHHLRRLYPGV